jgi:hypothetical protein
MLNHVVAKFGFSIVTRHYMFVTCILRGPIFRFACAQNWGLLNTWFCPQFDSAFETVEGNSIQIPMLLMLVDQPWNSGGALY